MKNKIKVEHLEPLADRILVKPDEEANNSSASGIIIPDNAKERPQTGTVISSGVGMHATILGDAEARDEVINKLGEQAFTFFNSLIESLVLIKNELKAGDKILFGKYAGQPIEIDGHMYLVMREADVIARINDTKGAEPIQ